MPNTYNSNLSPKVVLDLAFSDSIWGVILDDRSKFYSNSY